MAIVLEDPPAERRYSVVIVYDGNFDENFNYSGVKWFRAKNFEYSEKPEKDFLSVVTNLAHGLGYDRDTLAIYGRDEAVGMLKITSQEQVMKILSQQKFSRELVVYVVGPIKEETPEEHPTILSWNCRGYRSSTKAMLRVLNLMYDPAIVILIETRRSEDSIKKIAHSMGFRESRASSASTNMPPLDDFTVDTKGDQDKNQHDSSNCVGLAVLWKTNIELHHFDSTNNYIDFKVKVPGTDIFWKFTAVYGHPKKKNRTRMWLEMIKSSNVECNISEWLAVGDLNAICSEEEKSGGNMEKTSAEASRFMECLKKCDLQNLPYEGIKYTWTGSGGVKERLDRGVASQALIDLFPNIQIRHLTDKTISDHVPILVETDSTKQKPLKTKTLAYKMDKDLLSFIPVVVRLYSDGLRTVSQMRSYRSRDNSDQQEEKGSQIKDYEDHWFDIAQNVGPHLFQVKYIAVQKTHNNEKTVTCERLVTLATRHDLVPLFLNCMANPRPSREDILQLDILDEFPSLYNAQMIEEFNLSEYFVQTWKLVKLIRADRRMNVQDIVNAKKDEQVRNLIRWYEKVISNFAKEASPIPAAKKASPIPAAKKHLSKEASKIGRAVIVCNTIISLIQRKIIKPQSTTVEITKIVEDEYDIYKFTPPETDSSSNEFTPPETDSSSNESYANCLEAVKHVLVSSQCGHSITEDSEKLLIQGLNDLEKRMFMAERNIMLIQRLEPWIKLITEHGGPRKERLVEMVDTTTIENQIELLQRIGCISISKNKEIELGADKNPNSIVDRLERAADEALKMLMRKSTKIKSTTYKEYIRKLKQSYNVVKKLTKTTK